ncbi:hypothetical protein ABT150_28360 [Streptomyces mirabilis]
MITKVRGLLAPGHPHSNHLTRRDLRARSHLRTPIKFEDPHERLDQTA